MESLVANLPMLLFLVIGGIAVACSMLVVLMRNPVHSALFLLVTFLCVAVLVVMQGAEFVALDAFERGSIAPPAVHAGDERLDVTNPGAGKGILDQGGDVVLLGISSRIGEYVGLPHFFGHLGSLDIDFHSSGEHFTRRTVAQIAIAEVGGD